MPSVSQRYLVTGAAGFIASRVSEMLLADGHTVVGVDNLNDYYDVRLKDWRLAQLANGPGAGRFRFQRLDIEDLPALQRVFAADKFDAVFNLGARAGVRASIENPEIYRRTNVLGEENILRCQVKFGVRKHVLASSSSVYAGCPMPFTESAPLGKMLSPYAETKRQAELLAEDYHLRHGLDVTVLRYFTVFGPAGRPDMAPFRFVKWIAEGTPIALYGDGTQARDFTYVDDIARGTVLAARLRGGQLAVDSDSLASGYRSLSTGFEVINLGGGRNPISMHTVIDLIEKALGRKAVISRQPASAADIKETWADISKAECLLGWKPQITPEEGFQRTVAWYLANREWLKDIKV
jgi:nucleoside-diphosphate-sugar epimerase